MLVFETNKENSNSINRAIMDIDFGTDGTPTSVNLLNQPDQDNTLSGMVYEPENKKLTYFYRMQSRPICLRYIGQSRLFDVV